MLGAILAILSAGTFAFNNAAVRRGVVTGTPGQGMAITVPIGVALFLLAAVLTGEITRLAQFPTRAAAWMAAVAYGTSPIMARSALEHRAPASGILAGLIAYGAATAVVAVALLWPPLRQNVTALKRENVLWFVNSGVFVALAQGLFYAAVAVAPIMVVMPLLQLSLVFRLSFSKLAQSQSRDFRTPGYGGRGRPNPRRVPRLDPHRR